MDGGKVVGVRHKNGITQVVIKTADGRYIPKDLRPSEVASYLSCPASPPRGAAGLLARLARPGHN